MNPESSERRFALGRFVKNAAPAQDVVARILEERVAQSQSQPAVDNGADASSSAQGAPLERFDRLEQSLGEMFDFLVAVHEQNQARDKTFDTLHAELSDYKNDFFYERLKPLVRQLLFLLDSMREYESECVQARDLGLDQPSETVRSHTRHFVDQLADALGLIEVEPLEHADSRYDARTQRAVEIVPTHDDDDGQVRRIVRPGYNMGGALLRPADVVVAKKGSRGHKNGADFPVSMTAP